MPMSQSESSSPTPTSSSRVTMMGFTALTSDERTGDLVHRPTVGPSAITRPAAAHRRARRSSLQSTASPCSGCSRLCCRLAALLKRRPQLVLLLLGQGRLEDAWLELLNLWKHL